MNLNGLSLIVFAQNKVDDVTSLIHSIHSFLSEKPLGYEVFVIDKPKNEKIKEAIESLSENYNVKFIPQDKSHLSKAFSDCKYNIVCTLSEPNIYPIETIINMARQVYEGQADVLVAQRKNPNSAKHAIFGLKHESIKIDINSGLRVFRKVVSDRLNPHFPDAAFDLEFLIRARDAGYKLAIYPIEEDLKKHPKTHDSLWQLLWSRAKHNFGRAEVIPFDPETERQKGQGFHYKGQEYVHHSNLTTFQSALHRLSGSQMFILVGLFIILVELFLINWHMTLVVLIAALTFLYFADLLFNLYLIYRSFSKPAEVEITQAEINEITKWPTYTILCPLYKEWRVIPQFVTAMSHLDYPKDRLQVMLLLEEDDKETIEEVKKMILPSYFETVIVPDSKPKTKPKASNYGLKHATGEYIVIYDAEDVPDPFQLKKAILAYSKTDSRTICIQAKLNFYNPHQNLLTRVFTAEYSLWFDLVLTGLQSIHAPIPLGGTSNHFRKVDLEKLKGWDSFNVTEDCDLGMRLVKQGHQTAVINSVTLEEANSDLGNWFGQRTRWIKGYMQTYLIHMRDPREFLKTWREPHAITFQMVVGGKVLSMFINPLMWVITICYFMFRAGIGTFIESFFPAPVLYMGVVSLLLGNFLYVYYYMIGCAKHGHHELVKYGVFIPLYWLAMSIAAWMAVYKLIVAPHYWSKTKHGLHLNNAKAVNHAQKAIGRDSLIDENLRDNTNIPMRPAALI